MRLASTVFALGVFVAATASVASCSLGGGTGTLKGVLDVTNCWSGKFDLNPDFFAAVPYRNTLIIRVQNGSDYENFSDGAQILVDDVAGIRANSLGKALTVDLPPAVTAPGVPVQAIPDPGVVHFALYLQRSCELETPALYATRQVALNPDGSCGGVTTPPLTCAGGDGGAPGDGGGADGGASDGGVPALPVARSTITFNSLFDGNPDETDATQRLTDATFDVYLADPREVCPGGLGAPPRCRGHLTGSLNFYFERGRPAQPFP